MFWALEKIAGPMIDGLRRQGWSNEEIYFRWSDAKLREQLITHIALYTKIMENSLHDIYETITVKMNPERSFIESVAVGLYDNYKSLNKNINGVNFPINGLDSKPLFVSMDDGPYRTDDNSQDRTAKIVLVDMKGKATSDEALVYMQSHRLRPIGTKHLLAIGEQHPNIQRRFRVIALESSYSRLGGGHWKLGLGGSASERILDMFWDGVGWNEHTCFGAIPEEAL